MIEPFLVGYVAFEAAVTTALLAWLGAAELRRRRGGSRDAVLRAQYLRIVMGCLLDGAEQTPRFPMLRRMGARMLLVETLAGLVDAASGFDPEPLRRIVADCGLDRWLMRRIRRSRGFGRARGLWLLSHLPTDRRTGRFAQRYARSRSRSVRFQALLVRLAAEPAAAVQALAEYPVPFTDCEVEAVLALLRRGLLPIAYEPLVEARNRNLRIVGLHIVRQFGIEDAEPHLLRIVACDRRPDLNRAALYTLCALRRPLTRRVVVARLEAMDRAERKALIRYLVAEGYSPEPLGRLFGERERPYCESLVRTYKRSLA